ncbi:hypothetical protein RJ639_021363 [Escallonia herrerae]|uniref:Adipocyte plasma membrane-associated protein n=1 Tax=Escallonia herrerae TaxID=1293975 RepID=A0AA88V6T9_9ASTE|nr:hypothetical protein RJ639_021363 [Escallonia herrerae]
MSSNKVFLTASTIIFISTLLSVDYFRLLSHHSDAEKSSDSEFQHWEVIPVVGAVGPESFAFDPSGDGPYSGVSDGRIIKWQEHERRWIDFAVTSPVRGGCDGSRGTEHICGRPLGLAFDENTGDLYIADAYLGLLVVGGYGGLATKVVTQAQGVPFRFTNSLDIHPSNGVVYFTDSSSRYQRRDLRHRLNRQLFKTPHADLTKEIHELKNMVNTLQQKLDMAVALRSTHHSHLDPSDLRLRLTSRSSYGCKYRSAADPNFNPEEKGKKHVTRSGSCYHRDPSVEDSTNSSPAQAAKAETPRRSIHRKKTPEFRTQEWDPWKMVPKDHRPERSPLRNWISFIRGHREGKTTSQFLNASIAFPTTLRKAAHAWFKSLQPRSVHSFAQLSDLFQKHFISSRSRRKNLASLLNVVQEKNEYLACFLGRFNESVKYNAFLRGLQSASKFALSVNKSPPDLKDVKTPHDDPLVITIKAGNFEVKRALVDNGSSAEILFYDAFRKMNILTNRLRKMDSPLYGFSNHSAVVLTYHLKMKFPTENGIGEVKGDQTTARQCYVTSCRSKNKEALIIEDFLEDTKMQRGELVKNLVNIEVYPGDEDKTVRIGSNLKEDTKLELVNLLRTYADVFAWTAADMPGIDPETSFEELKTYLSSPPLLSKPFPGEDLFLYLSITEAAVSAVLVRDGDGVQKPIYYVSKVLQDVETRYPKINRIALALITSARRLRPYFQSHSIIVLTD